MLSQFQPQFVSSQLPCYLSTLSHSQCDCHAVLGILCGDTRERLPRLILHSKGQLPYLSFLILHGNICIGLKHSCVYLEHCNFNKFLLILVQYPLILKHVSQHLIFKGLRSPLSLILCSLTPLLLSLETRWCLVMIILKILNWPLTLLHSTYIRKVLMVSQGWDIVGWKVFVWLEVIASIPINKLSFLNLIGTFMSKSLISDTFLPSTFHHS